MVKTQKYDLSSYRFNIKDFFPYDLFYRITQAKIDDAESIVNEEFENRIKKEKPWNSFLVIIAADHPARNVTNVGDNEIAMANRWEYLGRILRILILKQIDGIMATPDIIEDLFILNHIFRKNHGKSFMDNKILLGCINRGGLSGSPYEMYDPVTAYNVDDIKKFNLDGAKIMLRLDLKTVKAKYSQKTLEICAEVIRKCNEKKIPVFIEPLPVHLDENHKYRVNRDVKELVKTVGVATALGGSSLNLWLKLPYVDNYELVALSTTNPILMLGGESTGNPIDMMEKFQKGMSAGKNIRGCLVGRNILYPGLDDPYAVALGVSEIIHKQKAVSEVISLILNNRGKDLDFLTSKII